MKEWVTFFADYTIDVINAMALLIIAVGAVEMFLRSLYALFQPSPDGSELPVGYLRFARWLIAGLTFQLAADVIETASAPTWDDIRRLAAIAVIRTFLNYFLERDIVEARNLSASKDGEVRQSATEARG
jgi:uncharacterized membrane protein